MCMDRLLVNILFILPLLLGHITYGQAEVINRDSVKTHLWLQEVLVRANYCHKEIIPVQILADDELQKLSVHSVADALRYFSGVQIKDYGGIGGLKTVNIRSMGSHHVGVFYDGVELGNAQNGVVDLGRFSLDNMEAISLYNGQKSSLLQTAKDYASASAIYMQARRPNFKPGKKHNLQASLKAGSFGLANPSLLYEHMLTNNISLSFSSEFLYTSGKYKFSYTRKNGYDTTEIRKNGDVRMLRIETTLSGNIKDGEWRTKIYYYNSERGYPGASVREEPGKFKHQDRQWDNNFFIQGTFKKSFNSHYTLLANGKYAYDYLHYLSDPRLDITTMYINNLYRQQEGYLSIAQLFTPYPQWSLALSNDFQWNTLNANLIDFVYPDRYMLLSAAASSIEAGSFKLQASLLHTFTADKTRISEAEAGTKSVFTPSVIASWKPFHKEEFYLRAFYKRIFRLPTLNDLYYTFIGNKNLNPEYTNQYNLGFTYSLHLIKGCLKHIKFQADGYFNQIDDKIIAMPTSNQFRWTMINLGYVEIQGIDIAVQGDFLFGQVGLFPHLTYTYQKAQDFTDSTSPWYGGQIPYIPWHSASLIIGGEYKKWSVNYSFIYTGERYEAVANIPENYAQPWYTHDIALSKTFELRKIQLRATTEINNIFNQQYEVVQCYPMPGINFKFKFNVII